MSLILGNVAFGQVTTVPPQGPLSYVELTPHPEVMAQPEQSTGRSIRTMMPHEGTLLIGFGDYGANTGPIAVCGYDLATGEPVTLATPGAPTEAIYRWKKYDGVAYAPWIDPEWYYGPGGYTSDETGQWESHEAGYMVHSFDLVKYNGQLVICGSHLYDEVNDLAQGCVWTQVNGTWEMTYAHGGSSRCYRLAVRDGKIWTRVTSFDSGSTVATLSSVDGVTWVPDSWPGPQEALAPWGDLGGRQRVYPDPVRADQVSCSLVAGGYVWAARHDGTIARAALSVY